MTTNAEKPRRRWLRFSLRTLFVAVTILGIFLGWLGVQIKWIRDRHEALELKLGFSFEISKAPWSIRILGEEGSALILIDANEPEQQKANARNQLQRLFPEAEISEGYDKKLQDELRNE